MARIRLVADCPGVFAKENGNQTHILAALNMSNTTTNAEFALGLQRLLYAAVALPIRRNKKIAAMPLQTNLVFLVAENCWPCAGLLESTAAQTTKQSSTHTFFTTSLKQCDKYSSLRFPGNICSGHVVHLGSPCVSYEE